MQSLSHSWSMLTRMLLPSLWVMALLLAFFRGHSNAHLHAKAHTQKHGMRTSHATSSPISMRAHAYTHTNLFTDESTRRPVVAVVAIRDIKPGEEILANYGSQYNYEEMQK